MKYQALSSLLMAALMAVGCQNPGTDAIRFDTVTVDRQLHLANEANSPSCTVTLQMLFATDENGHRAELINETIVNRLLGQQDMSVKAAAEQFADHYTEAYKKKMLPLYNQDRSDTTKRSWYEYHYVITTETQARSKGTVAYLATQNYYEGGAHGVNQLTALNFETNTGRLLSLSNIFVPGYEPQLCQHLLDALKQKTGCRSLAALRALGYLHQMDIYPPENFILGEETVTFVYNPYEIAPYSLGSIQLVIPYATLDKILKTTFDY